MPNNLKALLVVLFLAGITFVLARPICLRFMEARDFDRRRNVWLYVTALAFLSPSFWVFVAAAAPVLAPKQPSFMPCVSLLASSQSMAATSRSVRRSMSKRVA